jgi:nitroimidazol reductase NimA-like FMN-containing flavoprotein (pyridoxamine 5'-phosphate oxidase superfamily)
MRRLDKEIKDEAVIREILEESGLCRLGFVDNNEAYIVPVNYACEGMTIYFHSAPAGRKIELMKKNNQVSFEIEHTAEIITGELPCSWTARYRSVMGRGILSTETDPALKKEAMDLIMRKYGAEMELNYDENVFSRMIIIKLQIQSLTGKQSGVW